MNTNTRLYCLSTVALLFFSAASSQIAQHEKVKHAIINYFRIDREKIHLHLPKNVFSTGEEIWFKGYVLNTKDKTPSIYTSNVYAELIDSDGALISKRLVFSSSGSFSGRIELSNKMKTGRYYIRLYTNWMNNLREDHSSLFPVTIVNSSEKRRLATFATNIQNARIKISPEGGTLVAGVANNVGVHVADCLETPYRLSEATLVNEQNEVLKRIPLNRFGYGKFEITPNASDTYKIVINTETGTREAVLMKAQVRGLSVEINNYFISNKTLIKLRTSAAQTKSFSEKPLLMIIQQGGLAKLFEIAFTPDSQELDIQISNDQIFEGTNTIRFLDDNMDQIAERMVFKYPEERTLSLRSGIQSDNDSKMIKGMAPASSNLSISVLPDNTEGFFKGSLPGSFLLNSQLRSDVYDTAYYFDQPSKVKHYELDMLLLHQMGKYQWRDIMAGPLSPTHEFDYGLKLKGKVNQPLKERGKYRVRLFSAQSHLLLVSEINENNEFEFNHLVLADSSKVSLSLTKLPDLQTPLTASITASIVNGSRNYLKSLVFDHPHCEPEFLEGAGDSGFPALQGNHVVLEPVELESAEGKLTRQHHVGNTLLRGYKIDPQNNGQTIMNFLNQNGFDAGQDKGNVYIYGRSRTTIHGERNSPVIYLDDFRLLSLDELWGMQMADVDEVYLNPHAVVPGITNTIGVVRIYRKRVLTKSITTVKDKTTNLTIVDGYDRIRPFDNADYILNSQTGYGSFGLIHWIPIIMTGEDGLFLEKIPDLNARKIKTLIEGITPEGKMISEVKTLDLTEQ